MEAERCSGGVGVCALTWAAVLNLCMSDRSASFSCPAIESIIHAQAAAAAGPRGAGAGSAPSAGSDSMSGSQTLERLGLKASVKA